MQADTLRVGIKAGEGNCGKILFSRKTSFTSFNEVVLQKPLQSTVLNWLALTSCEKNMKQSANRAKPLLLYEIHRRQKPGLFYSVSWDFLAFHFFQNGFVNCNLLVLLI